MGYVKQKKLTNSEAFSQTGIPYNDKTLAQAKKDSQAFGETHKVETEKSAKARKAAEEKLKKESK